MKSQNKKKTTQLTASTLFGLESTLATELKNLGAKNITPLKRAVNFEGDQELLYRANLHLRTASRVFAPIASFRAGHPDELYRQARSVPWHEFMTVRDTFAIDCVANSRIFTHSKFAALKLKDAIVDQFRQKSGQRPSVDVDDPALRIRLHINERDCTLLLDSSGEPLSRRGYRLIQGAAPLVETLAAGLVLLSGWDGRSNFIDPMCGSGTILIEAALYAFNIPPGLYRHGFAFQKWRDYDADLWERIKKQALQNIRQPAGQLIGLDASAGAVQNATENLGRLPFLRDLPGGQIQISREDLENFTPPDKAGTVILNPPYGERLNDENIEALYRSIGDSLKQRFAGYSAWIISSNRSALKKVGLRPARKFPLRNGSLDCWFCNYPLYAASADRSGQIKGGTETKNETG